MRHVVFPQHGAGDIRQFHGEGDMLVIDRGGAGHSRFDAFPVSRQPPSRPQIDAGRCAGAAFRLIEGFDGAIFGLLLSSYMQIVNVAICVLVGKVSFYAATDMALVAKRGVTYQ
jgi:hypothetical protein